MEPAAELRGLTNARETGLQALLVEARERGERQVDLAAHLHHRRRVVDEQPQRHGADGPQVGGDVLAHLAVAAGGADAEHAVAIREGDGEPVDLGLDDVAQLRVAEPPRLEQPPVALVPGQQLLLVARVGQREHRLEVTYLREPLERRGADPLRRRVRRAQLRVLLLERLQLAVEGVVGGVVDLRRVEHVVQMRVPVDGRAQLLRPGRRLSLVHRFPLSRAAGRRAYPLVVPRLPAPAVAAQAQGEQLLRLVQPEVRPGRQQRLRAEHPPGDGGGGHAGRPPRLDVHGAVADVERAVRARAEPLQAQAQRHRRRLVLGGVAGRDDHLEVLAQSHGAERHLRGVRALAGHDAEPPARGAQAVQDLGDAVVAADELVVPAVVVLAVDVVELLRVLGRERAHLRHERLPDPGEDDLVGQRLVQHRARGVTERLDDELDGVDHGAVEVEHHRVEALSHGGAPGRGPTAPGRQAARGRAGRSAAA